MRILIDVRCMSYVHPIASSTQLVFIFCCRSGSCENSRATVGHITATARAKRYCVCQDEKKTNQETLETIRLSNPAKNFSQQTDENKVPARSCVPRAVIGSASEATSTYFSEGSFFSIPRASFSRSFINPIQGVPRAVPSSIGGERSLDSQRRRERRKCEPHLRYFVKTKAKRKCVRPSCVEAGS